MSNSSKEQFDLRAWLNGLHLGQFADGFIAQDVTYDSLLHLNQEDLKECGVAGIGPRKIIIAAIADLKAQSAMGRGANGNSGKATPERVTSESPVQVPERLSVVKDEDCSPRLAAPPQNAINPAPIDAEAPPAIGRFVSDEIQPMAAAVARMDSHPTPMHPAVAKVPMPVSQDAAAHAAGEPEKVTKPLPPPAVGDVANPASEAGAQATAESDLRTKSPARKATDIKNPGLFARIRRAYVRASGGSMLLSIGIHAVILTIGTYLVVSQMTEERKISFGGGDPGQKAEVEHKVKRKTTSAPAPNKRITTTSSIAKVALPDMPNVQMNMGPTVATSMGPGGFSTVGGLSSKSAGGAGGGGFSKITFFGLRTDAKHEKNLLKATFYDTKQTKSGKPTHFNYYAEVKKFVTVNNWDPSTLGDIYHAPNPLYAARLYVPVDVSEEAPKAFGVEKEVKPNLWLVHYKGRFRASKEGTFRFIGCGDNVLVVRLNKSNVLDGSGRLSPDINPSWNSVPEELLGNACANGWKLKAGQWFHAKTGELFDIEIVIGDSGGLFSAFLFYQEKGASYPKRKDGSGLAYPMFELDAAPAMPNVPTPKQLQPWNPDVVSRPGVFEGVPSGP